MEIKMYAKCNREEDTELIFNKGEITLRYTDQDPDYGTDELVYKGDPEDTIVDLAREQLIEITCFLDETYDGTWRPDDITKHYPKIADFSNSTLIAFERILQGIVGDDNYRNVGFGVNNNGHKFMVLNIQDASAHIKDAFLANEVNSVYIATDIEEGADMKYPDNAVCWFKIIRMKLPFDNNDDEIALLMGYCGGGNVAMAYSYDDNDRSMFADSIEKMITDSTGEDPDHKVYVEFIGVNDEHSYETSEKGE